MYFTIISFFWMHPKLPLNPGYIPSLSLKPKQLDEADQDHTSAAVF